MSQGRRNFQRSRLAALRKAKLRLIQSELRLKTDQTDQTAFHLARYTDEMLAMRRDASTPEQQAEVEKLYFTTTGKSLQDIIEHRIITALQE
jgi:hypothetical protein